MKFIEQIERIQYLDELIRKKSTGTPDELAGRLGISRSQLYNIIGYLNDIGIGINYSRGRRTFYYNTDGKNIEINFSIKIIVDDNVHKIHGGSSHMRIKGPICIAI